MTSFLLSIPWFLVFLSRPISLPSIYNYPPVFRFLFLREDSPSILVPPLARSLPPADRSGGRTLFPPFRDASDLGTVLVMGTGRHRCPESVTVTFLSRLEEHFGFLGPSFPPAPCQEPTSVPRYLSVRKAFGPARLPKAVNLAPFPLPLLLAKGCLPNVPRPAWISKAPF